MSRETGNVLFAVTARQSHGYKTRSSPLRVIQKLATVIRTNLAIDKAVYDEMVNASRQALPIEACGLLGGSFGRVTSFYQLTNTDNSPEHCSMLPDEQFAAVKDMRQKGQRMLAIWHSHPATPARMSEEDLRLAYTPDVAYAVLSLEFPENPVLRAYTVEDSTPTEVPVIILETSEASSEHAQ
jgi:proteasome lid subunit RPN8/RPN11